MEELDCFLEVSGVGGDVDLGLTVVKPDINATVDSLAVSGGVEDVADVSTVGEWLIGDGSVLLVSGVGESNQEFTTGEGVEVVIRVSLDVLLFPDLVCLSGSVDLTDLLVEVAGGVHVLPERLTVLGIIATTVVLLTTVVDERNTLGSEREDNSSGEVSMVAMGVKESSVVVVVNENTEGMEVLEVGMLGVVAVLNLVHGLTTAENVQDSVVHWVVEHTSNVALVGTNVCGITIEAFTHLEDTRGCTIFLPEILGNLRNSIDSDAIKIILLNYTSNPVLEVLADPGVAILVKIRQISESAVLNVTLVAPVSDLATAMVVLSLVERVDLGVISSDGANVVSNNINHNIDASSMGSIDEVDKVLLRSVVLIDFLPVGGPISVVTRLDILDNRGDPNSIESHALNVVKVVLNTLPGTTAVVAEIRTSRSTLGVLGESISKNLVNGSLLPSIGVSSLGHSEKGGESE